MNYKLEVDLGFVNLIIAGLSELPHKHVAQAIQAIRSEVAEQDRKAAANAQVDETVKHWADASLAEELGTAQSEKPKRKYTRRQPNGAAEAQPQA
jgi:hypothetical protein